MKTNLIHRHSRSETRVKSNSRVSKLCVLMIFFLPLPALFLSTDLFSTGSSGDQDADADARIPAKDFRKKGRNFVPIQNIHIHNNINSNPDPVPVDSSQLGSLRSLEDRSLSKRQNDIELVARLSIGYTNNLVCRDHVIFTSLKCNSVRCKRQRSIMERNTAHHTANLDPEKVTFIAVPHMRTLYTKHHLPTLSSLEQHARQQCPDALTYTFINGDIMLDKGFVPTIEAVMKWKANNEPQMTDFIIVGSRVNVPWKYPSLSSWPDGYSALLWEDLRERRLRGSEHSKDYICTATDYFVMSRNAVNFSVPPYRNMAIGRPGFDMYLVDRAYRSPHVAVINSRSTLSALHQTSPFNDTSNSEWRILDEESIKNKKYNERFLFPKPKERPYYGTPCMAGWWTHYAGSNGVQSDPPQIGVSLRLPLGMKDHQSMTAQWERKYRIAIALRIVVVLASQDTEAARAVLDALSTSNRGPHNEDPFGGDRVDVLVLVKPPEAPSHEVSGLPNIDAEGNSSAELYDWATNYCVSGGWDYGECGVLNTTSAEYVRAVMGASKRNRPNTTVPPNHHNIFTADKSTPLFFLKEDVKSTELPPSWYSWWKMLNWQSEMKRYSNLTSGVSVFLHNQHDAQVLPTLAAENILHNQVKDNNNDLSVLLRGSSTTGFVGFIPHQKAWFDDGGRFMFHPKVRKMTSLVTRVAIKSSDQAAGIQYFALPPEPSTKNVNTSHYVRQWVEGGGHAKKANQQNSHSTSEI